MRSITNGSLTDRDRLLGYTLGEFYQELDLYILECKQKEKELEKLKNNR